MRLNRVAMFHQAFHPAQRGGSVKQIQSTGHPQGLHRPALHAKGQERAKPTCHLPLGHTMPVKIRQAGIKYLRHRVVTLLEFCHSLRILRHTLHAQRQGAN